MSAQPGKTARHLPELRVEGVSGAPPAPGESPAAGQPAVRLSPSMMCADLLAVGEELERFAAHKVEWLHQDIMDGHFVPNLTLGIDFCRAVAKVSAIRQDVHLMVERPEAYLDAFASLPGARITFHPETTRHPVVAIERIRALGASPGLAVSPATSLAGLVHLLPLVDQVTVMTVNPGFAGQKLIDWCLPKISEVRAWAKINRPDLDVEVDGNVSWTNIPRMVAAGANVLVLGTSSLFGADMAREAAFARLEAMVGRPRG